MTYKPLPEGLTIGESSVDGLGLFATKVIEADVILGISHIRDKRFENNYIRTPIGGFINHSDHPNTRKMGSGDSREIDNDYLLLQTTKKILKGEELLIKYSLYDINEQDKHQYQLKFNRNG
tara:strand:- start:12160 stop:12522 length:363 start_codon:yes stop_codon:yes gene_type:complete